ncbi:MAG: ferritin-like domain-containing protein [Acidimicrobiales bacterium]
MSNKPEMIHASDAELMAMTRDLDQINQDVAVPAMAAAFASMDESIHEENATAEGLKGRRLGRRTFLIGAGAVAGGVALAACGTNGTTPSTTTTTAQSETASQLSTDLKVTALATSLENLVVAAYGDAITAATAGKYGKVPAAVPVFATTAKTQHAQHAAAWNNFLVKNGKAKVTGVPTALANQVTSAFTTATNKGDLIAVLKLALSLENVAAQTYQVGTTVVTNVGGIQLAASIQPVEMQHAAILYFVLGMYPGIQTSSGPVAFNPTDMAASLSAYTGPL